MLFGGLNGLIPLNKEEVLKRVSQEDIFKIVFDEVDLDKYYTNPTREDSRAGANFRWYNGILWFCDFADDKISRDCFEIIKDVYKVNFYQALEYINSFFKLGLGLSEIDIDVKPIIIQPKKIESKEKPDNCITYRSKTFDKYHRQYWTNYEITKEQLEKDNIYATIWFRFWSTKKQDWVIIRPHAQDVTFTIAQWDDAVKICRAKHKGRGKWITNCTQDHVGGIDSLPFTDDTLIITKSYKDWRVLVNQGFSCIWFQNEGMFPSKDKIESLCCTFKEIVIWFDNDSSGIKAANKLYTLINSFHSNVRIVHLPTQMAQRKITDPADCIHKDKTFFNSFIYKNFHNYGKAC